MVNSCRHGGDYPTQLGHVSVKNQLEGCVGRGDKRRRLSCGYQWHAVALALVTPSPNAVLDAGSHIAFVPSAADICKRVCWHMRLTQSSVVSLIPRHLPSTWRRRRPSAATIGVYGVRCCATEHRQARWWYKSQVLCMGPGNRPLRTIGKASSNHEDRAAGGGLVHPTS